MKFNIKALCTIICFLTFLAACGGDPKPSDGTVTGSNWWMFQGGNEHKGSYPVGGPGVPLEQKWTRTLVQSANYVTFPILSGNNVIVGVWDGSENKVHALSKEDGSIVWTYTLPGTGDELHGTPAAASGRIYFSSIGAGVFALNAADGSLAWERAFEDSRDAVAVGYGKVFVKTHDQKLYALDENDGTEVWHVEPIAGAGNWSAPETAPALGFGNVFAAFSDGLYAYNASDGRFIWKHEAEIANISYPAIQTDVGIDNPALIFITTADRNVHALKIVDGTSDWDTTGFLNDGNEGGGIAVADRRLFRLQPTVITKHDSNSGNLINAATAHIDANGGLRRYPVVARGILYYANTNRIFAVDLNDDSLPGDDVWESPAIAGIIGLAVDEDLLIVSADGKVLAFGADE